MKLYQGDIVKIAGFNRKRFVIVSKNAFIEAAGVCHVCPLIEGLQEGPLHIGVEGKTSKAGVVACEQIELIDPSVRGVSKIGSISFADKMNISDAIQGMFECD